MTTPSSIGELEFIVLLVVSHLGDDAYGAEIRRDVSARTSRDYSTGAIYASLQRLEDKGFLASHESEPLPVRGGRARRYFTLSTTGRSALRKATAAKQRFWEVVSLLPRRGA
jgi:DNA-binding PadR family transcriptional regulator